MFKRNKKKINTINTKSTKRESCESDNDGKNQYSQIKGAQSVNASRESLVEYCDSEFQIAKKPVIEQSVYGIRAPRAPSPENIYRNVFSNQEVYCHVGREIPLVLRLETYWKVEQRGNVLMLKLKLPLVPADAICQLQIQREEDYFEKQGYKLYEAGRFVVLPTEYETLGVALDNFLWHNDVCCLLEDRQSDNIKSYSVATLRTGLPLEPEFSFIFKIIDDEGLDKFFFKCSTDIYLGNLNIISMEPAFFITEVATVANQGCNSGMKTGGDRFFHGIMEPTENTEKKSEDPRCEVDSPMMSLISDRETQIADN